MRHVEEPEPLAAYLRHLKKREPELVTFCNGLKLMVVDGKLRMESMMKTATAWKIAVRTDCTKFRNPEIRIDLK